jgi:hypothetical protein
LGLLQFNFSGVLGVHYQTVVGAWFFMQRWGNINAAVALISSASLR